MFQSMTGAGSLGYGRLEGARRSPRSILGGAAFLATLLLLVPSASASGYAPGDPVGWTNGWVLCEFSPASPQVAVSSLDLNGSGLTASLVAISEVHPDGAEAATADLASASWTVWNLSTDDAYDLEYRTTVAVVPDGGAPAADGSANLSIQFVLPAYEGSPDGPLDNVTVELGIANWTWQSPGDSLEVVFGAAPSFPSQEYLAGGSSGWALETHANSTGTERERMALDPTALATPANGAPSVVNASSSVFLDSPQWATVSVWFASSAGEFTALQFTAHVGIVLPAQIAGIPLPELLAAAAAATVVSALVAISARRLRRRPSRLIYVEEEP
jgi:hypothetical protein